MAAPPDATPGGILDGWAPTPWSPEGSLSMIMDPKDIATKDFSRPFRPGLEHTLAPAWLAVAAGRGLYFVCPRDRTMTLRLTPDMLAAGYDFLRTTAPLYRWRLPHFDELGFHVVRRASLSADLGVEHGMPFIRASKAHNGHAMRLLATLAHEMIDPRLHLTGDRDLRGPGSRPMAARGCAARGLNFKIF